VLKQVTEQENGRQSLAFVLEGRQQTTSLAHSVLLVTRSYTLIGPCTSTDLQQKISFPCINRKRHQDIYNAKVQEIEGRVAHEDGQKDKGVERGSVLKDTVCNRSV